MTDKMNRTSNVAAADAAGVLLAVALEVASFIVVDRYCSFVVNDAADVPCPSTVIVIWTRGRQK